MKRARKKSKEQILKNRVILALAIIIFATSVFIAIKLFGHGGGVASLEENDQTTVSEDTEKDTADPENTAENETSGLDAEYISHIYGID